jgi:hypothetical protein
MDDQLVAIFDQCIGLEEPTNAVVKYDDGNAYLQRKRGSQKPLPPSQEAVKKFYAGTGGFEKIFSTFIGRSVLIGGALAMFGKNKNQKALIQNSLVASASIEAFLFYWYSVKNT